MFFTFFVKCSEIFKAENSFGIVFAIYPYSCVGKRDNVVRFLHLFKFGLVVLQNLFLEGGRQSWDSRPFFLSFCKTTFSFGAAIMLTDVLTDTGGRTAARACVNVSACDDSSRPRCARRSRIIRPAVAGVSSFIIILKIVLPNHRPAQRRQCRTKGRGCDNKNLFLEGGRQSWDSRPFFLHTDSITLLICKQKHGRQFSHLVKIYPSTYISHPIRFRQGTKHAYNFGKTELYVYFCCQYEVQIPRGRRCATRFSAWIPVLFIKYFNILAYGFH